MTTLTNAAERLLDDTGADELGLGLDDLWAAGNMGGSGSERVWFKDQNQGVQKHGYICHEAVKREPRRPPARGETASPRGNPAGTRRDMSRRVRVERRVGCTLRTSKRGAAGELSIVSFLHDFKGEHAGDLPS